MGNAKAEAIPILWSEDISVDVLTPLAILRTQVEPLRRMTRGLLEAEITTQTSSTGTVRHEFDLIAPALDDYRHRILTVEHSRDAVYPARLEAPCFEPDELGLLDLESQGRDWRPLASTQQDFIDLAGKVLRSKKVRSVIESLLARSNETNRETPMSEDAAEKRTSARSPGRKKKPD